MITFPLLWVSLALVGVERAAISEPRAVGSALLAIAQDSKVFTATALPGREEDGRVARLAFRLTTAGRARCPALQPELGIVWQHLTQFERADRAALAASQALNRGPEAIAVVAGGPGDVASVRPGDVLLAVDGTVLPAEPGLAEPFDAARARARADAIDDLVAGHGAPVTLTLLRAGANVSARLSPALACPARVHLARSDQDNAYADGRHVLLTTGLLARLGSDDELAFVLAHEMAHNILRHPALLRARGKDHALVRETERAADALAGELMLDAGLDPVTGVRALTHLGGLDLGVALFADHPSTAARIAAMRRLVAAHGAGR